MKRLLLAVLICVIYIFPLALKAKPTGNDSLRMKGPVVVPSTIYRSFEQFKTTQTEITYDPIIISDQPVADSIEEKRSRAEMLLEKVQSAQRFLESLDKLTEVDLPIGVVKPGGAIDYSILIDRINFTTKGAVMEVYVSLALPQNGHRITFNGKVPLSRDGGIAGMAKIFLVGDEPIKINNNTLLTIKATPNTFVAFDCSGFAGVSIEAEGEFSRELVVPENADGKPNDTDRVKFRFVTFAQTLNDLMVSISIPPFQIAGLKGIGFTVNQATIDWSDLANPPGIVFPTGYVSPFDAAGQPNLWQGFYLQRLDVRLPPAFTTNEKGKRVTLGVDRMILDDLGFTGVVFAENILQDGSLNGWKYSIDKFALGILANQPQNFSLTGQLTVPVIKTDKGEAAKFAYAAQRGADNNYIFSVKISDAVNLPLWMAKAKINAGSGIIVTERDDQFYPSAILNGQMTITALDKGPAASFSNIAFEGMTISTEAPYFKPGTFGFGSDDATSATGGYPVVIKNIMVKAQDNRVGLGFDVNINIGGKPEEGGFAGTASLIVWAKQPAPSSTDITQSDWTFDKVELSGVGINIKKPHVFDLVGSINFFDGDATYGKGFKGKLSGKIYEVDVQADALFGQTLTYRYWYADALVGIKSGIPLMPGLSAYGFGGGYYSKMKQTAQGTALGKTQSDIYYVPDESTSGVRAMMIIGTSGKPDPFNGAISLEIAINRNGGINTISLKGKGQFMAKMPDDPAAAIKANAPSVAKPEIVDKFTSLISAQVIGDVNLQFDNVNNVFHGNLEIYVNVAGGIVRGVSSDNKAGWATIHFEQNDWYILIGTPDQPIGLEVARIFKSKSYIMMGKNLPGSPPPPSQVSEILGNVNLDYMRDMNALQAGTGFAFGLQFIVDTGDLNFLMFYGRFSAGTGLDFMLKDYGTTMQCAETGSTVGINGWYANGQAYAFVQGKIGIKVNLKFYKGNYDILSLGAASILQAKGPNPFWMKGTVGGYYKILGGLIKGTCKFDVTIGKECTLVGEQNLLADVNIISSISPDNHADKVSVFNTPQVAFNIPVNKEFVIEDMQTSKHTFRATLNSFAVYDGETPLPGALTWNEDNTVVIFDGRDILPGQKDLTARAQLTFEENINGVWNKAIIDGQTVEEKAETTFKTDVAPDFIPSENIALSYPLDGQVNFYQNEYNQGFIQLKRGQPYLFTPGSEWIQKVRMTAGSSYSESDLTYNESDRKVNFTIPSGLKNSQIYSFEILNIPRQNKVIDANVTKVETEIQQSADVSTTVTTAKIDGSLDQLEVKKIFGSSFRTSQFNTFADKTNQITISQTYVINKDNTYFQLSARMAGSELFDQAEIEGINDADGFIKFEAVLQDNSWYQSLVYPLVYEGYPLLGIMNIKNRTNPDVLGIPPVRDMRITNVNPGLKIQDGSLSSSLSQAFSNQSLEYNLMGSTYADFLDLRQQAANYVVDHPGTNTPRLNTFFNSYFPRISYGAYKFRIIYRVPGVSVPTTAKELQLFNPVK